MKRISWFTFTLTVVSIIFSTSLTFAQDKRENYVVFKGGIYSPLNDDVEDFEDGINLEVAVGSYTSKYFGAELGLGFFQTKFTEPGAGKVTTKFVPITFDLLGRYPIDSVDIYGGGGIGVYISKTELTVSGISDSEADTFYGFQVLVGGKYNLPNGYFVGLEGKYIWTKTSEQRLFGVPIPDTHYDGLVGTINLGSRF